jgi:hypothetical protein
MYLAFGSPVRVLLLTVFFHLLLPFASFVSVFEHALAFNGDVSSWNVSNVEIMVGSKCKAALPSLERKTKDGRTA